MSLLSRLFRRPPSRKRAAAAVTPELDAPVGLAVEGPASAPAEAQAPETDRAPAALPATPALEEARPAADAGLEEADDEGADASDAGEETDPDPFVGSGEPLQISLPTADGVAADRREAEQLALSGPQRVTLTDPAGPGSLAETLTRLEAQGRVVGEVIDDPHEGPFILYRPVQADAG